MNTTTLYRGKCNYEWSSHLGNFNGCWFCVARPYRHESRVFRASGTNSGILVTYTDKRLTECQEDTIYRYVADVKSQTDYSAFGVLLEGRQWYSNSDTNSAIYGFNGMRKDNEICGSGNAYDFGARIYDPRRWQWASVDPYFGKYSYTSPYSYPFNNPLLFRDKDGKEGIITIMARDRNGNLHKLREVRTAGHVFQTTLKTEYYGGEIDVFGHVVDMTWSSLVEYNQAFDFRQTIIIDVNTGKLEEGRKFRIGEMKAERAYKWLAEYDANKIDSDKKLAGSLSIRGAGSFEKWLINNFSSSEAVSFFNDWYTIFAASPSVKRQDIQITYTKESIDLQVRMKSMIESAYGVNLDVSDRNGVTIFRCVDGCEGVYQDDNGVITPSTGIPAEERNHPK